MSTKRLFFIVFAAITAFSIFIGILTGLTYLNQHELVKSQEIRYQSYLRADELRQSSDDLTRFARTYVITQDPKYQQMYRDVLAIRNGEKPRPVNYERIYWDLFAPDAVKPRPDGRAVPLETLMQELGFTPEEFSLLQEAKRNSDGLVNIEEISMHAIKGLYQDDSGQFTKKGPADPESARSMMHSQSYHFEKAKIMKPIDDFFVLLGDRTKGQVKRLTDTGFRYLFVIIGSILALNILAFSGYYLIRVRMRHMRSLIDTMVEAQKCDDLSLRANTIATNEIGQAGQAFNSLMNTVQKSVEEATQTADSLQKVNQSIERENQDQTGLNALSAALQGEQKIGVLAVNLLDSLAAFLKFQTGILYVRTAEDTLERMATYALPMNKGPQTIHLEEGLIGQAARDQKPKVITEAHAYANILVGVGDISPANVLIYPLMHNEKTMGVLELGALTPFTPTQMEWIQKASSTMAVAIRMSLDIGDREKNRKELEIARDAADKANRAKGDFLANMSHEIRTPMNAIIGMSYLSMKTDLTPKQFDYIKKIDVSAKSLLGIINDILDFSKIEAGKLDMEEIEFDLIETVERAANMIIAKAHEKENVEVLFHIDPKIPHFLLGDPTRLGQVLINLGSNAVKFTEAGEVVLMTKPIEVNENTVKLQFSVRDTGIGMTEAQKSKLFQAFEQADAATTRKYGGTGLGLTISKRLVNMMGGDIWIESQKGVGSEVSFTASFGICMDRVKEHYLAPDELSGKRVLVVDDNRSARQIFVGMLESLKFEVLQASSGEKALSTIGRVKKDQPFDVILMDWKLPGIDGIETSRRILHTSDLSKRPKIILVTAYDHDEASQMVDKYGLDGLLIKPVSPSTLLDGIMDAFGAYEAKKLVTPDKGLEDEVAKRIGGARILLVEDNEINQQVAQEILERVGLHIDIACHGKEAVDTLQTASYDAVLMDIQMPVMDGYQATREIRQISKHQELPIIAMTASAMIQDREKALEFGMNDHVAKPIDPHALFKTLVKWIAPGEGMVTKERRDLQTGTRVHSEQPTLDLPGFDLDGALARMGGSVHAYTKILGKVLETEANAVERIQQSLDDGDAEGAVRGAHTLKGVAGNIGATVLQSVATDLEAALREGDDARFAPLLTQTAQTLNETFDSIRSALAATQTETPLARAKGADFVIPEPLIEKLRKQIDEFDSSAPETCDTLQAELRSTEYEAIVSKLGKALDAYDFDHAQELMEALSQQIGNRKGDPGEPG